MPDRGAGVFDQTQPRDAVLRVDPGNRMTGVALLEQRPGLRMARPEVLLLLRVRREVVELRSRGVDRDEIAERPAAQGSPAVSRLREQALHLVRLPFPLLRLAAQQRDEGTPVEIGGQLETRQVEQRGHDVDEPDALAHDAPAGDPRTEDDQRHTLSALVQEDTVGRLAVLAQVLAVIPGNDDQRLRKTDSDPAGQLTERLVHERDLPVVRPLREALAERGRRHVGEMGIEIVHPDEEGRCRLGHPPERHLARLVRSALHEVERLAAFEG